MGLPGDPHADGPHPERQALTSSGLLPTSPEVAGLLLCACSRARTPWHPCAIWVKQLFAVLFIPSHYHWGKRIHKHATSCLQQVSEKLKLQFKKKKKNKSSNPFKSHISGKKGLREIHKILNDTVSRHRKGQNGN